MEQNRCYFCGEETPPGFTIHIECENKLNDNQDIDKLWVLQDSMYGLGNFINLTPTLKGLSDHLGIKIPVYFALDFVKQCFLDCDFIRILDEQPYHRHYISSGLVDIRNNVPDYVYVFREVSKRFNLKQPAPHTYVDRVNEIEINEPDYTLFMYGTGNEDPFYLAKKTPPVEMYQKYMDGNQIFTGSNKDFTRTNWFAHMKFETGNIRYSLALIREATLIVTNDTGLAHAAGAMNKLTHILWKTSALPKNGNPGENTYLRLC